MKPSIENRIAGRLKLGLVLYRDVSPGKADLESYLGSEVPLLKQRLLDRLPPGFSLSRRLYKSFHIDPTRYRPSSEALWRRLKNRNQFPRVNPFVDLTNLLSLRFQTCYGLYDLSRINGMITADVGRPEEGFQGIRKDRLNMEGKIVLRDQAGAFGNPSADSLRTAVSESTDSILQAIFFHPETTDPDTLLRESRTLFQRFFFVASCDTWLT